jgi:hypothetical protein
LLCIPSQAVQVDSDEEEEEDDEDDEDFAEEEEELMNEHTGSGRSAAESASAFSSPRVTVFADPLRGEDPVALAELEGDSFYWPSARKRSLSGSFGMTDEDIGESSFSFSFSLSLSLSLSLSPLTTNKSIASSSCKSLQLYNVAHRRKKDTKEIARKESQNERSSSPFNGSHEIWLGARKMDNEN